MLGALGAAATAVSAADDTAPDPVPPGLRSLSLGQYLQEVLRRNEGLQVRVLELAATRRKVKAERGIFEPELVLSVEHIESHRPNTVEQQANLFGASVFDQTNTLYNGAVEMLVPSGAKARIGYNLQRLNNNLQNSSIFGKGEEYFSFVGINLTQPLLRNFGSAATMANIRLAAGASELAFQEYRRQLMLLVSRAEAAYWDLYLAQEQQRFFEDSVRLARTIADDDRTKARLGQSSELEVAQAEANLALRRSRLAESQQKLRESMSRVATLATGSPLDADYEILPTDRPGLAVDMPTFFQGMTDATELNPDYIAQRRQVVQEDIKLAYARNQNWPQLDVKASYGLNGLGSSPGGSMDDIYRSDFPAWTVGVELRIPLAGNIKGRNELAAARLRQQQSVLNLKDVENQLVNALDVALRRVSSTAQSVTNYATTVRFNQEVLNTQIARHEAGRVDNLKVFEAEETLFEARNAVLENLVLHQRALLELQLVMGTLLRERNLELSRAWLDSRTAAALRSAETGGGVPPDFLQQMDLHYHRRAVRELDENELRGPDGAGLGGQPRAATPDAPAAPAIPQGTGRRPGAG